MRFGKCTTTPSELPLLKRYGYHCFEANFQTIRTMSGEELEEMRRAAEETGVAMEGMNCFAPPDVRILSWSEQEADAYLESGLRRAKPLGLKYMVIGSGGSRKIPEGMTREEGMARFTTLLRRLGDVAAQYDIELLLEPLRREETDVINTVTEAVAVCEQVDHPRVGCLADFYHMSAVGEPFSDIAKAGKQLRHIHIATADRRVPLYSDKEELLTMIRELKAVGYHGRVVLEGAAKPDLDTALREFSEQFTLFD